MDVSLARSSALRKVALRITTYLSVIYVISVIDRSNVGIAALQMVQDIHLSPAMFGLGAGMFFVGYTLFEVPSNLALHKFGARVWLARIMITWGIIASAIGLVTGAHSYYILRFILGAAEAGYFPGILFFLTLWYPAKDRAKPYVYFTSCAVLAYVFLGPLSAWLMTVSEGWMGYHGWRWLFLLEGGPCVLLGIVTLLYLQDSPAKAKWLTREEKDYLIGTLEAERRAAPPVEHRSLGSFLGDGRLWLMIFAYLFWGIGNLGFVFWLPQLLKAMSSAYSIQHIGYMSALPYICALVGMHFMTWIASRTGRRGGVLIWSCLLSFASLSIGAWNHSIAVQYTMLCICGFFQFTTLSVFWQLPAEYLGGVSAAVGIAAISSMVGIGGLLGPWLVGIIRQVTGKFPWAIEMLAACFLIQTIFIIGMRVKRKMPGEPEVVWAKDEEQSAEV